MGRMNDYVAIGRSGKSADVDQLMLVLLVQQDLATTKLVDYALSLVKTWEGSRQLRHYLYNGELIQRNFAALYFKRLGQVDLLEEAVALGKIDDVQAFAK
jgi:hypothetical protein